VWAARARLQSILRAANADVLVCHSTWVQALFGSVLRASGAKLVFWLHMGLETIAIPELWTHWMARLTRPDFAICASQFILDTLRNLYPNLAAEVLYSPVSSGEPGPTDRLATRRKLGADANDLVIIQTSRLEPWKGHTLHLRALSRLRDVPGWVCWMVGGAQRPKEETYLREIQQLAAELGIAHRVRFLGQRSDVPALLRAADVHCQPNTGSEPFGIAFVEALYAGLPVVTTAIGGAREIVDETCGILVEPGDPEGLSQALRRLIGDRALLSGLAAGGPARGHLLCNPARQLDKLRVILDDLRNSRVAA
jgi:glycosyltransferase involved in cell wall biosynthesis